MKENNVMKWTLIGFIIIQCIINICLVTYIARIDNTFSEFKRWEKLQIDSIWENIQGLQNWSTTVIDVMYNPNNPHWLGL